ncbi:MAG: redoxin domain-containing protein [Arenibacter sp.]
MIYKHKIFELPLYLILSALYIIPKFLMSPFLYLAKTLGLKAPFLTKLDATVNKTVLPLTEVPDSNERLDVQPKLQKGDSLPSVPLIFSDVKTVLLKDYAQSPLLVIFVRGSWCSYSRLHLADIMSNKDKFESLGIKLLAITAYKDQEWWYSHGIDIPAYVDSESDVFKAFGMHIDSWIEYAWGRNLPHESVFLFDKNGVLVFSDVRKVNSILPGQRFLGSHALLEYAHKLISI